MKKLIIIVLLAALVLIIGFEDGFRAGLAELGLEPDVSRRRA